MSSRGRTSCLARPTRHRGLVRHESDAVPPRARGEEAHGRGREEGKGEEEGGSPGSALVEIAPGEEVLQAVGERHFDDSSNLRRGERQKNHPPQGIIH